MKKGKGEKKRAREIVILEILLKRESQDSSLARAQSTDNDADTTYQLLKKMLVFREYSFFVVFSLVRSSQLRARTTYKIFSHNCALLAYL